MSTGAKSASGQSALVNKDAAEIGFVAIVQASDRLVAVGSASDAWGARGPLQSEGIVLLGPMTSAARAEPVADQARRPGLARTTRRA
jgi:hypothetical protein